MNEKIDSELVLMPEKVTAYTKTKIVYVLVECMTPGCNHRWGVTPDEYGTASISMFLCRDCFAKQILDSQ